MVTVHHPDQRWWPDVGLRKQDAIDYYEAIAPVLLPHLRNRPLTLKRHYNGPRSPFEWIKDAPPELPDWIPVSPQPAKSRGGELVRYVVVDSVDALLWLVDFGCIDFHVWTSHDEAREFAQMDAAALVRSSGGLITAERSPARRHGVFVDTKMNGHGQQVVSAYSLRPAPGAPVATPIRWDEIDERLDPHAFTPDAVLERVGRLGDLFEPALSGRQTLRAVLRG
jgi:bifunctional non-homologous end joining protein LigD